MRRAGALRDCFLFERPASMRAERRERERDDFGVQDRPMAVHGDLDFSPVFCTLHFPRVNHVVLCSYRIYVTFPRPIQ